MTDLIVTICPHSVDLTVRDCNLCNNNAEIERLTAEKQANAQKQWDAACAVYKAENDRLQAELKQANAVVEAARDLWYWCQADGFFEKTTTRLGKALAALETEQEGK